jgi:hypothetical protein
MRPTDKPTNERATSTRKREAPNLREKMDMMMMRV